MRGAGSLFHLLKTVGEDMSAFCGKYYEGAMRDRKTKKRIDAKMRNRKYKELTALADRNMADK